MQKIAINLVAEPASPYWPGGLFDTPKTAFLMLFGAFGTFWEDEKASKGQMLTSILTFGLSVPSTIPTGI
jgi:hypothetical protein